MASIGLAAVLLPPFSPGAAAAELNPCRIKGIDREIHCGTVRVPENPDAAGADRREIEVFFAIVPALAKIKAEDPLFVFAGGPGQAATRVAHQTQPLFARLNARRDIVYIDQRGTGRSNPLLCATPGPAPKLAETLDLGVDAQRLARCAHALASDQRADVRYYATWIATLDAEAVRAALGYPRINLWGASYGTRVALDYLRRFPGRVRSAVLDGAAPADMALPASLAVDADAALRRLLDACAAAPACRGRQPQLGADLDQLLAAAGTGLRVTVRHPLTGAPESVLLDRTAFAALLRTSLYAPQLTAVLPFALTQAAAGDAAPLVALATALTSGTAEDFADLMHFAVICAEDVPRIDAAALAAARTTRFGTAFIDQYRAACAQLPAAAVPPEFFSAAPLPAAAPVLILSGGADPATPPRHGERIAARLGNARHLIAPNLGHGVSAQGCAPDLITRFVRQADFSGVDGACLVRLPAPTFFAPPAAAGSLPRPGSPPKFSDRSDHADRPGPPR